MSIARPLTTFFGVAAVACGATLAALWPRETLADGDDDAQLGAVQMGDTQIGDVLVEGAVVRDPKSKTGWAIDVKLENRTTEAATADVTTELTRAMSTPMTRSMPVPRTVWRHDETVTLASGETAVRHYEVPAGVAKQLAASARFEARMRATIEKGEDVTPLAMQPRPFFALQFTPGAKQKT
jgi:hypothetical protein